MIIEKSDAIAAAGRFAPGIDWPTMVSIAALVASTSGKKGRGHQRSDNIKASVLETVKKIPNISHGVLVNRVRRGDHPAVEAAIAELVASGEILGTECGPAKRQKPTTKYVVA